MKILYITNVRLPTHRAHGLQVMKMCEAFKLTGADIRLIAPDLKPSVPEDPFSYYGIRTKFPLRKTAVLELVPWQRWLGSWVSYVENFSFALSAIVYLIVTGDIWGNSVFYTRDYTTAFVLALLGRRLVFEMHDYRPTEPKARIAFTLRRCRLIITNSEGTRDAVRAHYDIPPKKISALPNGVDATFYDVPQTQIEAKARFGIPEHTKVISYIGRLETMGLEKGVSLLIHAFAAVRQQHADAFLLVVGGPDEMVGRYRDEARSVGIPDDSVRFTGQVPYATIPELLRATDIGVIPFPAMKQLASTASPLKVFEFMAAGKTILASDLPSLRRYLNERNAAFFTAGDGSDLAEKLGYLLDHTAESEMLAAVALNDARQHSWTMRAKTILSRLHV